MTEARKKIVCIEDDRETAALIAEDLGERGFEAVLARDGQAGLKAILEATTDLVLCDISMPVMSGFEVLERLTVMAPRFQNMPFVFLTALSDRDTELKARQLGADDYVTKPIDFDLLATIIAARLTRVARAEIWPAGGGAVGTRGRGPDLVGARQDLGRDRADPGPVQAHCGLPRRQRARQAGRGHPHPGGGEGGRGEAD